MSSLVTDVLHSAGKLVKENIVTKVDTLKRNVEDIKLEFQDNLKSRYIDFLPQYIKLDKSILSLNEASTDYEALRNQIEEEIKPQMSSSVTEFHTVVEDLKKIKVLKEVVSNLAGLHQHLEEAKAFLSQSLLHSAAEELLKFDNVSKSVYKEDQSNVEIYSALRQEFSVTKEQTIFSLQKKWKQMVDVIRTEEIKKEGFQVSMAFRKNASPAEIVDVLASLKLLNWLQPTLKAFGKQFLCLVCETVVMNTTKMEISDKNDCCVMTIIVKNDTLPDPQEVFQKLGEIFKLMHSKLFGDPTVVSADESDAQMVRRELGSVLCDELCSMIIEKCLKPAVPRNSTQLLGFQKEVELAQNFSNIMLEIGFFTSEEHILHHFLQGVDTLPANKMAQEFLCRSRSLMKESLHQTVSVGIDASPAPAPSEAVSQLTEVSEAKSSLSKSTFEFPNCQISISAKSLVLLLHEVMSEAKNIGKGHTTKFYYVAHSICDLYCYVVPTYHKNEIETIPQQTAIFHNNCMYIAHCLLMLGPEYKHQIDCVLPMTFVDLVPKIRKLGIEAFLAQMRRQRQQLLELLQDRQAFENVATDASLVNRAEKLVRQCLCQLQLVKKVWAGVLPQEVYFKSVGTLLNTCLEEFILHIVSMEDITAEAAAQLDSIFVILLTESPHLLEVPSTDKSSSVHNYVRRWFKFQELQLVLSSSLKEIVDRWASGKGPLATHFTADNVKHLIRALFQNTERRAASLAKIR